MDPENQNAASPWASRRRAIILGAVVLLLSGISFGIFWKYWYSDPTCFDKMQNGDESGVDCGGSCALLCGGDVIEPIVKWDPRLFEVLPGLWSALVYVENPNINADAVYLPYSLTIYDEKNTILKKRDGATILPRNKTVGIFEGSITTEEGEKPRRAVFELGKGIIWKKDIGQKKEIVVTHSSILKLESSPRIEANVKNNNTEEIKNIELVAAIFDGSDNVIAASRTFIESLPKNDDVDVFFTWPKPFELGSKACERLSDTVLLLDRSGSMASLGDNPLQPLTSAKEAAASFIEKLNPKDKVGIISFATEAKEPIDSNLTSDFTSAKLVVESVNIESGTTQYTNIYGALHSAWQELISARGEEGHSKIVILLTDGVANNPRNPTGGSEEDDIKYAESLAVKEASEAKRDGIIIYTIGLGDKINESFLKAIASDAGNYFFAPSSQNLETIYAKISTDICKEVPARVEITYKIFGSSI